MKKTLLSCLLLSAAAATSASAWLVGDNITLTHYYPDLSSPYESHNVTVAADSSDLTYFNGGAYQVDPGASSIDVNFLWDGGYYWNPASFNGLVVSNVDSPITGVTVSTNLAGWDNSRLSFTSSSISANWQSLGFDSHSYFNLEVQQGRSVPEAGSTLALFGGALVAFVGLRRKFAKA